MGLSIMMDQMTQSHPLQVSNIGMMQCMVTHIVQDKTISSTNAPAKSTVPTKYKISDYGKWNAESKGDLGRKDQSEGIIDTDVVLSMEAKVDNIPVKAGGVHVEEEPMHAILDHRPGQHSQAPIGKTVQQRQRRRDATPVVGENGEVCDQYYKPVTVRGSFHEFIVEEADGCLGPSLPDPLLIIGTEMANLPCHGLLIL